MRSLDEIFTDLKKSPFRMKFALQQKDREYLEEKGLYAILEHAAAFIEKRLAPAHPFKDGKQTPWRGHPVFVAQHATATCCRGCLAKWHDIPKGHYLNDEQKRHVIEAIRMWLLHNVNSATLERG